GHRRGRQVLARALPRRVQQGSQGKRRGGGDPGPRARPDSSQAAVARLHDLLSRRYRCCLDRAEEVRREGRRRRLQEGARPRRAALKRGEVDIAYNLRGELAQEIRRTPGLTLKPNVGQATHWVYFAEQWDPKSPWHDRRVRLAANYAIDRQSMNQADALGYA